MRKLRRCLVVACTAGMLFQFACPFTPFQTMYDTANESETLNQMAFDAVNLGIAQLGHEFDELRDELSGDD